MRHEHRGEEKQERLNDKEGTSGDGCRKREKILETGSEQSDERDKEWLSGTKRAVGRRKGGRSDEGEGRERGMRAE